MKAIGLLVGIVLLAASPAAAREVKVTLTEGSTGKKTLFAIDTRTAALRSLDGLIGVELRQISRYRIRDRQLVAGEKALARADEVLFQCRAGGTDLVVVRAEENSLSSPWKLFSACSGHPVQVSVISVLVVEGSTVTGRRVLARQETSYRWTAAVLE
jgi:hypothetical protein